MDSEHKSYTPDEQVYGDKKYIGNKDGEEYFVTPIKFDCGWYFGGIYLEGLRPECEEDLRARARETEPEDIGLEQSQYFDMDRFKDDMEEDWQEKHDVQKEEERDGVQYYLGFGCHTHFDSVILGECEGSFEKYCEVFDKPFLSEKKFNELVSIAHQFYDMKREAEKHHKKDYEKYADNMRKVEDVLRQWSIAIIELPSDVPRGYWVNPEVEGDDS